MMRQSSRNSARFDTLYTVCFQAVMRSEVCAFKTNNNKTKQNKKTITGLSFSLVHFLSHRHSSAASCDPLTLCTHCPYGLCSHSHYVHTVPMVSAATHTMYTLSLWSLQPLTLCTHCPYGLCSHSHDVQHACL